MGASLFYPARSVYPKVLGTGGGGGPSIVTATMDQSVTTIFGGTFTPLADNQNGIMQKQERSVTGGTDRFNAATDAEVLAPLGSYGSYPATGKRACQVNFSNNFTGVPAPAKQMEALFTILGYTIDGVGVADSGISISIFSSFGSSGNFISISASDLTLGIGAPPVSTITGVLTQGGKNSVGFYSDSATGLLGVTIDGVDQGVFQNGGADYVFTLSPFVGFVAETRITSSYGGADAQDDNALTAALILQNTLITEPVPAGSLDFGGNAI